MGLGDVYKRQGAAGARVVVQGAGSVGSEVARLAHRDGARLIVADVDTARAQALAEELDGETTSAEEAPFVDAEVFAPCAVARVITRENVPRIRARLVAGAANDSLDTPECAEDLRAAGVDYVPDFVANAGGVIQVHGEVSGWSEEEILGAVDRIGERVTDLLRHSDSDGITALDAALHRAAVRLGRAGAR